jgi:formylglycine-generating enzyme required for sulfatase activity
MNRLRQNSTRRPLRMITLAVLLLTATGASGRWIWVQWDQARQLRQEYQPPPEGMVLIPAGKFLMGSDDPNADFDVPAIREVFVPACYIDQFEVTNREYRDFKSDHPYPDGEDEYPVTRVLKHEAEVYARWAGKRLPTGAEWEKAARGTDGRKYPWGNEYDRSKCNLRPSPYQTLGGREVADTAVCRLGGRKMAVGQFPKGVSPYGVHDMCGNAWEWVSDVYVAKIPFEPEDSWHRSGIIRGGAHGYGLRHGTTFHQGFEPLNTTCNDVGFRCAMAAAPKSN